MAGASMKDIKLRIRSVESTMQITKAMQLVATSKLRKAMEHMDRSKPYVEVSGEAVAAAIASCQSQNTPYVNERELKKRCYIIIAGERGLAGGYNANIFKEIALHSAGHEYCVFPIGRKAIEKYAHNQTEVLSKDYGKVESLRISGCHRIISRLLQGYLEDRYQEIWLIHTHFQSMMSQEVLTQRLLPVDCKNTKPSPGTVYDPDPETVLEQIMPSYLSGRLYSALCDSFASEVCARRNAMDSATKNAGEMIDQLRLHYNRARQGSITQEITEIVAGADR